MERRDLLALCAAPAAAAIAPSTALAATMFRTATFPLAPPGDMSEYIARVDAGLARIRGWSPPFDGAESTVALTRGCFEALFLRGMLGDLPLSLQVDERMQQRIFEAMPVFDDVTQGVSSVLGSCPADELRELQSALRQPDVSRQIAAAIDSEAALTGVSEPRRAQLSRMLEHVSWRMTHQPPSLIVDEYVDKVERAAASDVASAARQQRLASLLGEKAFWGVAEDRRPVLAASGPRWAGARVLGIDVVHRSSGVAVAASMDAGQAVGVTLVLGATVGVIALLVYLVKATVKAARGGNGPKDKTKTRPAPAEPSQP
jgi:hypothetical protein